MMSANLYLICAMALLLIGGFFSAVQLFRGRMSWGQARRMGIPMVVFGWMIAIYYLVLFEGMYGFVGFILDFPLWIDVLLFLVIFGFSMAVYFKLIHREKFKPTLFIAAFLVPLSIPGLHTAARLIPSKAPIEIFQKAVSSFPQIKKIGNSGYMVKFSNSQEKGTFGDSLTATRLTAQGYRKLESKSDKIRGIDGVYVLYEKSSPQKIQDILIVENKVDSGQLNPKTGQMTNEWIEKSVDKMIANDRTRSTGELIRANPGLVRTELWRHDLNKGSTTIHRLDGEANIIPGSKRTEHYIDNLVRKRCESKQSKIVCHPVNNKPMPAPDPDTRAHLEWLGFLQPNGLVVSAPALAKAGAILNRQDTEGRSRLLGCIREREIDPARGPEPCIPDFRRFAAAVLGWGFSPRGYAGTEEAPVPAELEAPLPDYGEVLRPDFAVRERGPAGWYTTFSPDERLGYSGVGLYARPEPERVETSLGESRFDIKGRFVAAGFRTVGGGRLAMVNCYFPQGSGKDRDNSRVPYKLNFYRAVFERAEDLRREGPVLVIGDYNTTHREIDLARPKANVKNSGFLPEGRSELGGHLPRPLPRRARPLLAVGAARRHPRPQRGIADRLRARLAGGDGAGAGRLRLAGRARLRPLPGRRRRRSPSRAKRFRRDRA